MYQVKVYHKGRKKGQQFMGKHTDIKIESRNSDNLKIYLCNYGNMSNFADFNNSKKTYART